MFKGFQNIPGDKSCFSGFPTNVIGGKSIDMPQDRILWFNSDIGITPNGTTASVWADRSPMANHATQTAATSQSLIVANAINGHSALLTDGVNDRMNLTNLITLTGDFSFFGVMKIVSGYGSMLGHSTSQSTTNASTPATTMYFQTDNSYTTFTTQALTSWAYLSIYRIRNIASVYVNGILKGSSSLTGTFYFNLLMGDKYVFSSIYLAELMAYARGTTTEESAYIETYYKNKFGL